MDLDSLQLKREFHLTLLVAAALLALQVWWMTSPPLIPGALYVFTDPGGARLELWEPSLENSLIKKGGTHQGPVAVARAPGPISRPNFGYLRVSLPGYRSKDLAKTDITGGRYPAQGAMALEPELPVVVPLAYKVRDYAFALAAGLAMVVFWGLRWRPYQAAQHTQLLLRKSLGDGRLPRGLHLHQYEVQDMLGQGGMAAVYRVRVRHQPGDFRALKVLLWSSGEESWRRFMREAEICKSLTHPHIVPLYDWGDLDGLPYLVMDLVEGLPLSQVMTRERDWRRLLRWVLQVVEALQYAHMKGVLHRDLKPSNVMIRDRDGLALLMDFGIARHQDLAELTAQGDVMGTPGYMAPEQFHGTSGSASVDLYALGVTLYEVLTLQRPFEGDSPMQVIQRQLEGKFTPLRVWVPEVPEPLEELVCSLLHVAPDLRPGLDQVGLTLESILAQLQCP